MKSVREVAAVLQVSPSTVYQLCATGRLAHYRIGASGKGAIRVSEEQLQAYLQSRERTATEPEPSPCRPIIKPLKYLSLG